MRKILFLVVGLLSFNTFANQTITVCTDNNFWYPFTFVKDKQATGLHIDVISTALSNLNYKVNFKPLPWKRCLSEAEQGIVDGVATASYKDKRAVFMHYPDDASSAKKSNYRVTQVEYIVITSATDKAGKPNSYSFNGDVKTLPLPVRMPSGYSLIESLQEQGLKVDTSPGAAANFKKLARDQAGSVVDLPEVAKHFSKKPQFQGKFVLQPQPIKSKSYYFTLTKKGKIDLAKAQAIWQEIAKVRDNEATMAQFMEKY